MRVFCQRGWVLILLALLLIGCRSRSTATSLATSSVTGTPRSLAGLPTRPATQEPAPTAPAELPLVPAPTASSAPETTLAPQATPALEAMPAPPEPAAGPPSFGPILFAAATQGGVAGEPATSFAPNVDEIFAVWSYSNMPPGILYTRRWYRNGELWLEREEAWTRGTNGWVNDVSIYNRTPEGFQPGQYRLDLLIEGQVVQSAEFIIGGSP